MRKDCQTVFTENPDIDQWRLISQYTYEPNIEKYFRDNGISCSENGINDYIAGCIRQGEAYFKAAKSSDIAISPLLLYYGTVSLYAGCVSLINGAMPVIRNHGMTLTPPSKKPIRIADCVVVGRGNSDGCLTCFDSAFSRDASRWGSTQWSLEEILGSIPDIRQEFSNCYPAAKQFTIPVEIVENDNCILERIDPKDLSNYSDWETLLNEISYYKEAYLPAQYGENMTHIIMNRRRKHHDIGEYSILGGKHLKVGHNKNQTLMNPCQMVIHLIALYALGMLSRYSPEIWNPFVSYDGSGERLVVEKYLAVCSRYIPNLVLNKIQGHDSQFSYEIEGITNKKQQ